MSRVLTMLLRWVLQKSLVLLFILAVLLAGAWIRGEWARMRALQEEHRENRQILQNLQAEQARLQAEIERLSSEAQDLLEQFQLRAQRVTAAWSDLEKARAELRALEDQYPVRRFVPGTAVWTQIKLLSTEITAKEAAVRVAEAARDRMRKLVQSSPPLQQARSLADVVTRNQASMSFLTNRLEDIAERLVTTPGQKAWVAVKRFLPAALIILLAVILTPVAIKAFLYFIVAPHVSRLEPIRILPESSGQVIAPPPSGSGDTDSTRVSAVSRELTLAAGEELLLQADYLQSSSREARKVTQWLLNARLPLSSLAAGLFALVRIGGTGGERVVISSLKDALSEVGIIELPAGSALVCQPRCLAGVVKPIRSPVKITRHWRLGHLHSWLTLQLRYLAFHGPCKLIVKGCRGIRVEQPDRPRLINQAATLGFSANLEYANTRCETFVSYWMGKEDLFNDLFQGGPGCYVYEEMPALHRKTGITGRGLEGLLDAVLKVFGV
jgi:cell division protein FtsB